MLYGSRPANLLSPRSLLLLLLLLLLLCILRTVAACVQQPRSHFLPLRS